MSERTLPLPGRAGRIASLLVLGCAFVGAALAAPPAAALEHRSADSREAELELATARADLQRARLGLSAAVQASPDLNYELPTAAGEDPTFDLDLEVAGNVRYRYDAVDILVKQRTVLRAEDALRDRRRDDVAEALLAHAALLRAVIALPEAERELALADAALATFETAPDATDAQLRDARLDLDLADLAVRRAQAELATARSEAEAAGVGGEPSFEPVAFELPIVPAEATLAYRDREATLRLARLRLDRDGPFDVIREVELSGAYETTNFVTSLGVDLDRGRPGASVSATYDLDERTPAFVIGVSARFRVDDRTPQRIADLQAAVAAAEEDLASYGRDYARAEALRLEAVGFALEALALSREAVAVSRDRALELEGELASLPQRIATARADAEAATDRDERRAQETLVRDLERRQSNAERELERLQDRAAVTEDAAVRAWISYVRAVDRYLDLVDGDWVVAEAL